RVGQSAPGSRAAIAPPWSQLSPSVRLPRLTGGGLAAHTRAAAAPDELRSSARCRPIGSGFGRAAHRTPRLLRQIAARSPSADQRGGLALRSQDRRTLLLRSALRLDGSSPDDWSRGWPPCKGCVPWRARCSRL